MKIAKSAAALLLAAVLCLLTACAAVPGETQVYRSNGAGGITLEMQAGMKEKAANGLDVFFAGRKVMFSALKETPEELAQAGIDAAGLDVEGYAALVAENNGLEGGFTADEMGNLHVTYDRTVDGVDYTYYATVRQNGEDFWTFNFACFTREKDTYLPYFPQWADTIRFK